MSDLAEILTSVQAAEMFGVDPSTTKRAAAAGLVEGAGPDPRPGTINPPWAATEMAWRNWFANRRPVGRPAQGPGAQNPLLSRADNAGITRAEWVPDQKGNNLYWWTVWTDKTGNTAFRVVGVYQSGNNPLFHEWEQQYAQGSNIQLADLSSCPVPTGIMAFAESERGVVLATIGRIRDQLEPHCGPLLYIQRHCKTRHDTVDPSAEQMAALESALGILMTRGVKDAVASLQESGLFSHVFHGSEGCPAAPARLPDGVFEWR